MAPFPYNLHFLLPRSGTTFSTAMTSNAFREQWKRPGDVFSVLLILGGDVVNRALAQLAGTWLTPVTFSFGIYLVSNDHDQA